MKKPAKILVILCLLLAAILVLYFNLSRPDHKEVELPDGSEAMFYEKLDANRVQCKLCFRNCIIPEGEKGFCQNRKNSEGNLYNLTYSRPAAVQVDPVEKEPQHHFLPGTDILCLGTAGCNFRCVFCHNWHLSQRTIEETGYDEYSPAQIVEMTLMRGLPTISFTYNEPTVFYEFMYETARLAKEEGIRIIFHSNGSLNSEPLKKLLPYVDGVTIDLKGFTEDFYREASKASLNPVLETLKIISQEGVWLEIVNLVIPGLNDDPEDIRRMCQWIYENLGPDVPLHFSRFFPAYRLTSISATPVKTLEEAYSIAREEGLRFVSIGNVPGHPKNSTYCPVCDGVIIDRHHFTVRGINLEDGRCGNCGELIPGVWEQSCK